MKIVGFWCNLTVKIQLNFCSIFSLLGQMPPWQTPFFAEYLTIRGCKFACCLIWGEGHNGVVGLSSACLYKLVDKAVSVPINLWFLRPNLKGCTILFTSSFKHNTDSSIRHLYPTQISVIRSWSLSQQTAFQESNNNKNKDRPSI